MAKRARGAVRPGQRRPGSRPQQRPSVRSADTGPAVRDAAVETRRSGGLTSEEERRAAELEERIVAEERAAEVVRRRRGTREREGELGFGRPATAQAGSLPARSGEEYAYVVRDVRRIVAIGGALLVVLFGLFGLIEVGHVIHV